MKTSIELPASDAARCVRLIGQAAAIERHVDLLHWLRGDVQDFLPHDILLAGWGNFHEGNLQHDIVSALSGVRSYAPGTELVPFLLEQFYKRWLASKKNPCRVSQGEFEYLLGSSCLPGTFCGALRDMRSVLIHGISDQRTGNDCLYVLLGAAHIPVWPAEAAISVLMPCIDTALRRLAPLLQQGSAHNKPLLPAPCRALRDTSGLSERETQIMAWVAMGKTNSEIGSILSISGFTVKNHLQRIFQKLNVSNRAQAVSTVTRVALDA